MGGKTSTSTSSVQVPAEVLAQYKSVTGQANNLMGIDPTTGQPNTPFKQYSTDPNAFVAPLTQEQKTGIAGTNTYANAAQPYYGAATGLTMAGAGPANLGTLDTNRYMSPYMGDVIGSLMAAQGNQNAQQRSALAGQAAMSGAYGGDRYGVGQANLAYQQDLANNQVLSSALQSGYTQAQGVAQQQQGAELSAEQANLARLTGAGSQIGSLGTAAQSAGLQGAAAQQAAGATEQQTQQAGLSALYNQFQQQQAYPFQVLGELANISEGIGAQSGSTTTTQQPSSFFSDARLKEDIEPVGKTFDGQTIYKYRYKGEPGKQIGLIAQDVQRHHPDAVGLASGFKTVDYDAATKDAADRGHFYSGGLVSQLGEGFAGGGGIGPEYDPNFLQTLLATQKQMYAGMQGTGAKSGPASAFTPMQVHGLQAAPPPKIEQDNALQDLHNAMGTGQDIGKLYDGVSSGLDWLNGSADVIPDATGNRMTRAPGGVVTPYGAATNPIDGYMGLANEAQPGASPGLKPAAPAPTSGGSSDLGNIIGIASTIASFFNKGGAVRNGYADGGDPMGDTMVSDNSDVAPPQPDKPAGYVPNPNVVKYLDTVVAPRESNGDPGLIYGGGHVTDYSQHPHQRTTIPDGQPNAGLTSDAAGKYQFLSSTWDPIAKQLNLPDFSLDSQTKGAAYLADTTYRQATGRDLGTDYASGDPKLLAQINQVLSGQWTSLAPKQPAPGLTAPAPMAQAPVPSASGLLAPQQSAEGNDLLKQIIAGQKKQPEPDWMARNQDWLVPTLTGLGAMASSPSRYLGSALLQGIGAGAGSYEATQKAVQDRQKQQVEMGLAPVKTGIEALQAGAQAQAAQTAARVEAAKAPSQIGLTTTESNAIAAKTPAEINHMVAETGQIMAMQPAQVQEALSHGAMNRAQAASLLAGQTELRTVPGLGTFLFNKIDKTATKVDLGIGGAGSGTTATPQAAPGKNDVPNGYVPPMQAQMYMPGNEASAKAALERGTAVNDAQQKLAAAANNSMYLLQSMNAQTKNLPTEGLLVPGSFAPEAYDFAAKVNQLAQGLGGAPVFDPNNVAASQDMSKDTQRLGFALSQSLGHEPGFIVQQATMANPSISNTPMAYKRIASSLEQAAEYQKDKAEFFQNYMNKFQHLEGAQQLFDKTHPVPDYVERSIINSVPPEVVQKLQDRIRTYGPRSEILQPFNKLYGADVSDIVRKRMGAH